VERVPTLTVLTEQCLAPVPGGTGRYAGQLAAALAVGAPAGWRVRTVTAWHRDTAAARVPGAGHRRLPAGRRALAVLWQHGLPPWPLGDSVHASTPLVPRRGRRPLVATVHDMVAWTDPETLTPRGVAWHRAMITRVARTADGIVVPTQVVAHQLRERFQIGDRVHVVGHGVSALPVPVDAAERRRRLGLPDAARYVLFIGTVEPRKGLDVLVQAMAHDALGGVALLVIGPPGWGRVDAVGLAASAGLSPDRLVVAGRRADGDIAAALDGASVLAMPSRAEGFGLPVLEAMAAGVPVVHSAAPALVEVAGGCGVEVPVGDPSALADGLARVIGDASFAAQLVDAGRRRAAEFSWANAARRTWDIHLAARQ
jgi:glycosyltransferase involved in cell wall biosynthesis